MEKVVLASNNSGKLAEMQQLLSHSPLQIVPQRKFNVTEVDETGLSFVENALLKARNACEHTGLPAIGDDSGLEVDALQGAPGIYSARYAGIGVSFKQHIAKLLEALEGVAEQERSARFVCLLVYLRHATDPTPLISQGSWEGRILTETMGESGFGYDPVFWVPTHQCSAAQLSAADKSAISHRGQALKNLLERLQAQR